MTARADWRALLAASYRRGRRDGEPVVDVSEMAASPEGMAAIGLAAALADLATTPALRALVADGAARGDVVGAWDCGHGGDDGPHDLHCVTPPDRQRDSDPAASPGWQRHLLHRYCRWRADGGAPGDRPRDTGDLDPRLVAIANAAARWEVEALAVEVGQTPAMQRVRLAEYRRIGEALLRDDPALAAPRPGPADGPGLPRRSWQPAPVEEDDDVPAPEPDAPAAPGGGRW
jgi:hypothetical protein